MTTGYFERGMEMRKGAVTVACRKSLAASDDFTRPMQELVTEFCWGAVW